MNHLLGLQHIGEALGKVVPARLPGSYYVCKRKVTFARSTVAQKGFRRDNDDEPLRCRSENPRHHPCERKYTLNQRIQQEFASKSGVNSNGLLILLMQSNKIHKTIKILHHDAK